MINPFAGVKLWAIIALCVVCVSIGAGGGYTIGGWKAKAGFVSDFKACANDAVDDKQSLQDAIAAATAAGIEAANKVEADNKVTEERQLALLNQVEGIRNETRKLADVARRAAAGSCGFTDTADRLRHEAWERAARAGVSDPAGAAGETGRSDADGGPAGAEAAGGTAARGAGAGRGR